MFRNAYEIVDLNDDIKSTVLIFADDTNMLRRIKSDGDGKCCLMLGYVNGSTQDMGRNATIYNGLYCTKDNCTNKRTYGCLVMLL